MPIEIRELIIRATVSNASDSNGEVGYSREEEREALVTECVEQVMEILREEKER